MNQSPSTDTPIDYYSQYSPKPREPWRPQKRHKTSARTQDFQQTSERNTHTSKKTTNETDGWFSVRDIIHEKKYDGKLYYLIDWENDPRNGQPFEPTWEPEENVTEVAKTAWLARCNEAQLQSSSQESLQEDSSVPVTNWRRWQRVPDHQRGGQVSKIVVLLPSRPNVDTSEYTFWPASQDTHECGPDFFKENPLLHSQDDPSSGAHFQTQLSQREIPDSQSVSATTQSQSQPSRSAPHTTRESTVSDSQGAVGLSLTESATLEEFESLSGLHHRADIPSHQPGSVRQLTPFSASASQASQPLPYSLASETSSYPHEAPDFLTQVPFDFDFDSSESQPVQIEYSRTVEESQPSQPQARSVADNSQAAQIVPALNPADDDLRFQTQVDFDIYDDCESEDEVVVPETVRRPIAEGHFPPRRQQAHQDSQDSSQALSEVDGNNRTRKSDKNHRQPLAEPTLEKEQSIKSGARAGSQRITISYRQQSRASSQAQSVYQGTHSQRSSHISRPVTPDNMDDSAPVTAPMSAKERMRLIRERHLGTTPEQANPNAAGGIAGDISKASENSSSLHDNLPELQSNIAEASATDPILSPSLILDQNEPLPTELTDSIPFDPSQASLSMPSGSTDPVATLAEPPLLEQSVTASELMDFSQPLPLHFDSQGNADQFQPTGGIALADLALNRDSAMGVLDPAVLAKSIEEGDIEGSPSVATDDATSMLPQGDQTFPDNGSAKDEDELDADDEPCGSLLPEIPTAAHEYVITLPFFSSTRPQYNDIIREHEQAIQQYTSCFSITPHQKPNAGLIAKIDDMFTRLFDICDIPPFVNTLPSSMSAEEITKHVVGTNPKMCFIYEFLLALRDAEMSKNVTILVRPGQVAELLTSLVQAGDYTLVSGGQWPALPEDDSFTINVAILSTTTEVANFPKPDAYIVYDHTFDHQFAAAKGGETPLVMVLTLMASIQHLNMRVSEKMEVTERKNFMILAMVKAMNYIEEPDYLPGLDKPHEAAYEFAAHLMDAGFDDFHYEGQLIPEGVFQDLHEMSSSQIPQTQIQDSLGNGSIPPARQSLKRAHNELEEATSKRVRLSQPPLTGSMNRISEPLRNLLGDEPTLSINEDTKVISVSIDRLETMAEMITNLQTELRKSRAGEEDFRKLSDRSKREVDSYTTSIKNIQTRFMTALKDRGTFEADCKKAQQEAEKIRSSLENSRNEASLWREKHRELDVKLQEANKALESGENPELARVSRLETEITQAREAVEKANKKAESAEKNNEYFREAYQNSSRAVSELQNEKTELTRRLDELSSRASDNVRIVNENQTKSEAGALIQLLNQQKSIVRDREIELARLREEMRYKNGRRETRQSSVPRSPRMSASIGFMSPRNGQSRGGSGSGMTGASSRGTSPVNPPMGVFEGGSVFDTPAASRFAHLRE